MEFSEAVDRWQAVPTKLKAREDWALWVLDQGRKVPVQATMRWQPASSTDPSDWGPFERALEVFEKRASPEQKERHDLCGLGLALFGDDLIALDLDKCVDEDGGVDPWAIEVVELVGSYCEYSPSGRGLRMFAKLSDPHIWPAHWHDGRQAGHFEIYRSARYVTVTGRGSLGSVSDVATIGPDVIDKLQELFPQLNRPEVTVTPRTTRPIDDDSAMRVARAWIAKRAPAIRGRMGGKHTFSTAAQMARFGLSESQALEVMLDWNARCQPPWDVETETGSDSLRRQINRASEAVIAAGEFGRDAPDSISDSDTSDVDLSGFLARLS
jgi:hypothetical protein